MTDTMSMPVAADDDATPADRKKLFVAGGLVGALVLGAGAYLLLGSGGGDSSNTASNVPIPRIVKSHVVAGAVKPATGKVPTKVVKPATKVVLPASSNVKLGRDPFKALYAAPVAAASTTGATGTPTSTSTTAPTTPTADGSATAQTVPYTLWLRSVDSANPSLRRWTFTVDKTQKTVVTGQKFGKYGELVVLAAVTNSQGKVTGALIQIGDANPLTIHLSEKITVA